MRRCSRLPVPCRPGVAQTVPTEILDPAHFNAAHHAFVIDRLAVEGELFFGLILGYFVWRVPVRELRELGEVYK